VVSIGLYIIIVTIGYTHSDLIYNILYYLSLALSAASVFSYGLRGLREVKKGKNEII
jgi:hypothetical protein